MDSNAPIAPKILSMCNPVLKSWELKGTPAFQVLACAGISCSERCTHTWQGHTCQSIMELRTACKNDKTDNAKLSCDCTISPPKAILLLMHTYAKPVRCARDDADDCQNKRLNPIPTRKMFKVCWKKMEKDRNMRYPTSKYGPTGRVVYGSSIGTVIARLLAAHSGSMLIEGQAFVQNRRAAFAQPRTRRSAAHEHKRPNPSAFNSIPWGSATPKSQLSVRTT